MQWIEPDWDVPPQLRAAFSLRTGGVSRPPYASLNLATHVGDEPGAVRENRRRLARSLALPAEPVWLRQVHGRQLVPAHQLDSPVEADASWTDRPGVVCAVLVADCLPILLADSTGRAVAAVHAGWRGLRAGVVTATVARLARLEGIGELQAWLGPCIGPAAFELGPEVREAFLARDPHLAEAFVPGRGDRWHGDLHALARHELQALGLSRIHACPACTYKDAARFYSFRRDRICGRMAAMIWLDGAD